MCEERDLQLILDRVVSFSKKTFGDGLREVILYGSYARGDQTDDSDIDIMILSDDNPEQQRWQRTKFDRLGTDLALTYDIMVSPTFQSYDTFNAWRTIVPFYRNIDTEGIRIHA